MPPLKHQDEFRILTLSPTPSIVPLEVSPCSRDVSTQAVLPDLCSWTKHSPTSTPRFMVTKTLGESPQFQGPLEEGVWFKSIIQFKLQASLA